MNILTNFVRLKDMMKALPGVKVDVVNTRSLRRLLSYLGGDHDIVYFAKFTPPIIERLSGVRGSISIPLIVGLHAPFRIEHINRPYHIFYNLVFPFQVMNYYKKFNAITHALSRDDLKECRFCRRMVYMPLGTDTDIFKPGNKGDVFTIIYAARASWQKGTDIFVRVMVKLLSMNIKYKFQVRIISYGLLEKLYEKITKYGNVELLKYLPINEYAKVLSESHVLVFTSRYESFGLLPLDAMASGVPVVSFDVRGFVRDYLRNNPVLGKYVVEFNDVDGLIRNIINLMEMWYEDRDHYNKIVQTAYELAAELSYNKLAEVYMETFGRACNGEI